MRCLSLILCAQCDLKLPKHNVVVRRHCVTTWKCSLAMKRTELLPCSSSWYVPLHTSTVISGHHTIDPLSHREREWCASCPSQSGARCVRHGHSAPLVDTQRARYAVATSHQPLLCAGPLSACKYILSKISTVFALHTLLDRRTCKIPLHSQGYMLISLSL